MSWSSIIFFHLIFWASSKENRHNNPKNFFQTTRNTSYQDLKHTSEQWIRMIIMILHWIFLSQIRSVFASIQFKFYNPIFFFMVFLAHEGLYVFGFLFFFLQKEGYVFGFYNEKKQVFRFYCANTLVKIEFYIFYSTMIFFAIRRGAEHK